MLNSTSTGAVCFNASNQALNPSGNIMAASCRATAEHYALDVSTGLRDPARHAFASGRPSPGAARGCSMHRALSLHSVSMECHRRAMFKDRSSDGGRESCSR
jgi:hypothetical protein